MVAGVAPDTINSRYSHPVHGQTFRQRICDKPLTVCTFVTRGSV